MCGSSQALQLATKFFVERPPLLTFSVDHVVFEEFFKVLLVARDLTGAIRLDPSSTGSAKMVFETPY